jgi:two-component system sensor kinase
MRNNKILLLDDDVIFRSNTHEFLVFEKYDVKSVSNGQEGLDLLDDWIPDLILCDMLMPVMDGFNFHELVKQIKYLAGIPFVFISEKRGGDLMRKCLLKGADDLLFKPFKSDKLLAILESKLERFKKIKNAYSNIYIGENKYLLHEVNTPLNGIIGVIELLSTYENDFTASEAVHFHNAIKVSGDRLSRTWQNLFLYQNFINNNLEFSTGSSTSILERFIEVNNKLNSVYGGVEERIIFKVQKSNIKISQKYLDFILYELIDNALKFSGNQIVTVTGEYYNTSYFSLVITDSGIGFSPEELQRIDAGQQFNREEREQQGLGLGLFLSKKILKKEKGLFTIISKKETGTQISLFLPLHAAAIDN